MASRRASANGIPFPAASVITIGFMRFMSIMPIKNASVAAKPRDTDCSNGCHFSHMKPGIAGSFVSIGSRAASVTSIWSSRVALNPTALLIRFSMSSFVSAAAVGAAALDLSGLSDAAPVAFVRSTTAETLRRRISPPMNVIVSCDSGYAKVSSRTSRIVFRQFGTGGSVRRSPGNADTSTNSTNTTTDRRNFWTF